MKRTLKIITLFSAALMLLIAATGCSKKEEGFNSSHEIGVISREDGSGTRSAFIELFGIEEKNDKGEKVDNTTLSAVITDKTSVMMTTVAGDLYSIGYISLGSLNDTVRAVEIDGATPSAENIKNDSYKISRPFNIVTKAEISAAAREFISFIMSSDGQKIVEQSGYIPVEATEAYSATDAVGKATVSGSSSVAPVMEKLKEAFEKVNKSVTVEVQQHDSSTGISNTIDGTCDIGMASRELKDSEIEKGVSSTVIAMDGIAVIVNNNCPVTELTSEQVKSIFTGETELWSDIVSEQL